MSDCAGASTTSPRRASGTAGSADAAPVGRRTEYAGSTCRPTEVAPGPASAGAAAKLRCRLDVLCDRVERTLHTLEWQAAGLADRVGRVVGRQEWHRRIPIVRAWRSPIPIVAPVFLVGSERSGTTILGQILGRQGEVHFVSEARPTWYRAVPEIDERNFRWNGDQLLGRIYLDEHDVTEASERILEEDFGRMLRLAGRRRLMEKMPLNLFRVRWLRAMWPDAKFIQIVRDPFSTRASKVRWWPLTDESARPGVAIRERMFRRLFPALGALLDTICTPYEWFLFEWRADVQEGERLAGAFPEAYHAMRLEDVQRDPEGVLERACSFAGLRFSERLRRAQRTLLDRDVRLAEPAIDRVRCREILGDVADRWGYVV